MVESVGSSSAARDFATEVVQQLQSQGFQALWAGGCVRDFCLGRTPGDYDVATSARPADVRRIFRRTLSVGASFGVVIVVGPTTDSNVEVATFRADGEYEDGRRPKSVSFCSAEEDAKRRDFTVNGMFYDPIEECVLDYVGGQEDLEQQIVRAIGDPVERFQEDKLRLLRAVRFATTLGFALEPETASAARGLASEIGVVSAERITQELKKMLAHGRRRESVEWLQRLGLLLRILPELTSVVEDVPQWTRTLETLDRLASDDPSVALAALLQSTARFGETATTVSELAERLRWSNDERHLVTWLLENMSHVAAAPDWPPSRLHPMLAHRHVGQLLQLARAIDDAQGGDGAAVDFCVDYLRGKSRAELLPSPFLSGNDLIEMGLKPGPLFKSLLDGIRDQQLDGLLANRSEALAAVAQLLSERESGKPESPDGAG